MPLVVALTVGGQPIALANPDGATPEVIARLVGDVARADEQLAALQAEVHSQQESVMKALHQVQSARETADSTQRALDSAQRQTQDATDLVGRAQQRFDQSAAAQYVRGPSPQSLLPSNPEQAISTAATQQTLALAFSEAREGLQRARVDQANAQSSARIAQQRADQALRDAQSRHDEAVQTLRATESAFSTKEEQIESAANTARLMRERLQQVRGPTTQQASPPAEPPSNWDTREPTSATDTGWDTATPAVPRADLSDPVAIVNSVLQVSAASAQLTTDLGRRFLVKLGLIPSASPPTAAAPGRIPRLYGQQAVEFAIRRGMSQLGVPYSWGGGNAGGPTRGIDQGAGTVGFDCSGLMVFAFAGVGINLPKYSGAQYDQGRRVPVAQMRRGDLIFWGPGGSQHVAIYLGQGQMLESPFTGSQVRIAPVRASGMTTHVVRLIES
ncbi:NlpC/P60 family protein [Mycobacterium sp. MBM]|nr:NlpC/P60 family protein [Mycobacterium sp. MBM]